VTRQTEHEFGGIGQEMNQWYVSRSIYTTDEEKARREPPADKVLEYEITTYPGARCPHAWLNTRKPVEPISTLDLGGHLAFCVLTGPGGDDWKKAAEAAAKVTGVKINAYSIGWMQDYEDVYGDWARRREIEDDGCVLLRPDRTVCWRSMTARDDAQESILKVLRSVLCINT